jgi:hypothetical protein
MKAAVVYESMFGNTRALAEAVADGLAAHVVQMIRVSDLRAHDLDDVELLVVGGPTHGWSMSRPSTREGAAAQAADPARILTLEPGATDRGLREWLTDLAPHNVAAAAFDTRVNQPRIVTGAASRSIARQLRRNGCRLVVRPESFLVTTKSRLVEGELTRARSWGAAIAATHAGTTHAGMVSK